MREIKRHILPDVYLKSDSGFAVSRIEQMGDRNSGSLEFERFMRSIRKQCKETCGHSWGYSRTFEWYDEKHKKIVFSSFLAFENEEDLIILKMQNPSMNASAPWTKGTKFIIWAYEFVEEGVAPWVLEQRPARLPRQ